MSKSVPGDGSGALPSHLSDHGDEDIVPLKGSYLYVFDLTQQETPIMMREYAMVDNKADGAWPQFRASAPGLCPFVEDGGVARERRLGHQKRERERLRQPTTARQDDNSSHPSTKRTVSKRAQPRPATPTAAAAAAATASASGLWPGSRNLNASPPTPTPQRAAAPSISRVPSWVAPESSRAAQSSSNKTPAPTTTARGHFISPPETSFQPRFSDQTRQATGSHNPSVPSTIRPRSDLALSPPPPHQQHLTPPGTTNYPIRTSPVGSGWQQRVDKIISEAPSSFRGESPLDSLLVDEKNPFLKMEEAQALDAEQRIRDHDDIRKLLKMPNIEIPPELRAKTPIQMSCKLMEHQKVALKWLKDQENNKFKRGGLLADTMGLGKTIEALALILSHPAPEADPKTTLIIAPLALLKQWDREIASKVKPAYKLSTYLYHGREKTTRKASKLFDFDIVITTYETVSSEYKAFLYNRRKTSRIFGPGKTFHRIVLDEAHKIKNRFAQCSEAVAQLDAKYRLCMTGTVFMNNTAEIYALIRFLRIKPYHEWPRFNEDIGKPLRGWDQDEQAAGMRKLQVLFRSITLRRTKDSYLDGEPIITLPKLSIASTPAIFDEDQKAYYYALEKKQQIRLNKYLKQGRLSKVYTFILVLLLRLRQACDHPFLIKNHGIPDEAQLDGKQMLQLAMRFDQTVVNRILRKERFQCPLCDETAKSPMIIYPCGHDICSDCFSSMMQVVLGAKMNQALETSAEASQLSLTDDADMESICPHDGCEEEINPKNAVCHHIFLDAHAPDSGSRNGAHDLGTDQEDDSLSESESEDEDEDTDDDEASLRDFIAPDDEEESDVGEEDGVDEEGDVDKDTDNNDSELNFRSCVGRTPTPIDDLNDSDVIGENEQGPSRSNEDDIWTGVFSRYQQSKKAKNDCDTDSDGSLVSIRDLTAKAKAPKGESAGSSLLKKSTTDRKRPASGKATSAAKRVRREGGDEFSRKASKPSRKSKKKRERKELTLGRLKKAASGSKAAKDKYRARLRKDFESSAKIDVTLDLLRSIRAEKPGEKTLVFSLWTSFLDLLEIPLEDEGFRFLRYDGSMSFQERDGSIRRFDEDPTVEIMLVSLMAGNAGLNLTAASQVIMLEPFWNPFVEDQAVDRTHRIGQARDVDVHRLLVANSVEDRILELQEKKRRLVNAALSEEGAVGAGRLSIGELRGLFGIR